jgi:uncharacterized protein
VLSPALLVVLLLAEIPPLTGRVVDRAGMLSPGEIQRLEQKLESIERRSTVQIAIATIPSLEGDSLEDFSIRLAEAWRIGQKGLDNGAIILVVRDDRSVRIEVGYGLEPVVPDGLAGRIIRERLAPELRQERYYEGLDAAIDGLALAARREYPDQEAEEETGDSGSGAFGIGLFVFYAVGLLGNALGYAVAGVLGALALSVVVGLTWGFSFLGLLLSVVAGFPLGLLAMLLVRSSGRMGGRTWSSGSSGRSGGWGGGFSGGGGRFGGGGASGRW